MSEPKDIESGDEAQADREAVEASGNDAGEGTETEASEAVEAGEGTSPAPKKKKKKAREPAEPENIRDRNARVRAEAADKRRARREREQGTAPRRNLDASEVMDDALARSTHAAANFLTKHFNKVQWLIMAGLVGWIGYEVYSWRHARTTEKATDAMFKALAAESGKVGADEPDTGDANGAPTDARRSFPTDEARLKAAKAEYVLASGSVDSGTAVLADLGLAGVDYDLGQYKDAQAVFEKVKQHPAYASDSDIKGRTLEGLGMALEAQKNDEAALKTFRELSNMDGASFSALGFYHQARILKAQGNTDDALKMLDKAGEKLATLKETPAVIKYLGGQVIELLELIDPKKAKELGTKLMSSDAVKKMNESANVTGPGGQKISAELQKRIQEMMDKQKQGQPITLPPGPVAPAPAPDAPPTDAPAPNAPTQDAPPGDAPVPAPAPSGAP